jgi:hypothetical protein
MKHCTRPEHEGPNPLPESEFGKLTEASDGLNQRCRACERRRHKAANRVRREAARAAVFGHYGQTCVCCGTTENLTIDHMNGDGRQHREEITRGKPRNMMGAAMCRWLIKQGFPPGYQVLCLRCNSSKGAGERCKIHGEVDQENRSINIYLPVDLFAAVKEQLRGEISAICRAALRDELARRVSDQT